MAVSPLVSFGACEPGLGVLLNENYVVVALLRLRRTARWPPSKRSSTTTAC
ncbi:hypothetical protein QJS66_04540 [Kocuria rhizophila]|nr:hypothetical protein QJS66_04540 [Kocuria rhizophila]